MGYIYKIKNDIDDKLYIGQTVKTIDYRFKEHIRTAKNEYKNKKHLTLFHKIKNYYDSYKLYLYKFVNLLLNTFY